MFAPTDASSPDEYIAELEEPRRSELMTLHELVQTLLPGEEPYLLSGMIAYGHYHYKGKSGREGDWAPVLLASRKQYISLYLSAAVDGQYVAEKYKSRLPKANIGRSCIRFRKLADVDLDVLKSAIKEGAEALRSE
jgi:hypothetical protein